MIEKRESSPAEHTSHVLNTYQQHSRAATQPTKAEALFAASQSELLDDHAGNGWSRTEKATI